MEPIAQGSDLKDFAYVSTALRTNNVPIINMSQPKSITGPKNGCAPAYYGGINFTNAVFPRELAEANMKFCNMDFKDTILANLTYDAARSIDEAYSQEFMNFTMEAYRRAVEYDVKKITFFGDKTSSSDVTTSTANGVFKFLTDFGVTAVADNSGDPTPTGSSIVTLFTEVYRSAPQLLLNTPDENRVILCSGTLYSALKAYLAENTTTNGFMIEQNAVGRITGISFFGIPIMPQPNWGEIENNGSAGISNKIIYTVKGNIAVGLSFNSPDTYFRTYVDPETMELKFLSTYAIGTTVLYPQLVSWAK